MFNLNPFNADHLKQIEDAIAKAEKKTSGEIVFQIAEESHHYYWIYLACAFFCLAAASIFVLLLEARTPFAVTLIEFVSIQVLAFLIGLSIASVPFARRAMIPRKRSTKNVHQSALAQFVLGGMLNTQDRNGVLIYTSLLEHRVEIIADRGINEKVPEGFWQNEVDLVSKSFRKRDLTFVLQAIEDIGEKLSGHFPPNPDNPNELPNKVINQSND